jgi:hypothetical protein
MKEMQCEQRGKRKARISSDRTKDGEILILYLVTTQVAVEGFSLATSYLGVAQDRQRLHSR